MSDERARRAWLLPAASGVVDGIDLSLLDPADEGDRQLLLLAEHPELAAAIDAGQDEVTLDGTTMNPHLHLAMHEVVANQIWDNNPPEVWSTAQRLTQAGYDRHEAHARQRRERRRLQRDVGQGAVRHHPYAR